MKVTLNVDSELEEAIQEHLNGGPSVQAYVKAALSYFSFMRAREREGKMCGFGDKARFSQYNTEASPRAYLGR